MRSLWRNLEVQLDTPWLLNSRRQLIAEELFWHIEDHRSCLEEEGVPQDAAWAEAWASFGDLKAVAGDFLAQHRLEAYAFYSLYILGFAALLWPLPSLINYWFTGNADSVMSQFTGPALGNRLLVTWELFWLFVLVRTAHCTSRTATHRWAIIGLLFPGYLLLGVLTPFILNFYFQESLATPWLAWFDPHWMSNWNGLLGASLPQWIVSSESGRESFIVMNIIGIYLIRAYAIEGCWQGRDWPRLLIMSLLLIVGLTMFFQVDAIVDLNRATTNIYFWSKETPFLQVQAFGLNVLKHLLLVGYFVGGLRGCDALYGLVVRSHKRAKASASFAG